MSKSATVRRSTYFRDGVSRIDYVLVQDRTKSEALRLQNYRFVANLKKLGLKAEREKGVKYDDLIFIKIHAPDDVLKRIASIQGVPLTYEKDRTIPQFSNRWGFFKTAITIRPNLQNPLFARCSESVRGEPTKTFTTSERIMLTDFVLSRVKYGTLREEYGLANLLANNNLRDAFPLHDGKWEWEEKGPLNDRQVLGWFWGNWKMTFKAQPLHIVYRYFGSEIAFHYAWLGFYTAMIFPLAVIGVLVYLYGIVGVHIYQYTSPQIFEVCQSKINMCPPCVNPVCVPVKMKKYCKESKLTFPIDNSFTTIYAFLVTIWSIFFLELWRRKEYRYLYQWNLMNVAPDIDELADYKERTKKYVRKNPHTGQKEHFYPTTLQIRQFAISAAFCFICILLIIATVMFIRLTIRFFRYKIYLTENDLLKEFSGLLLKCYSGVASILCIKLYGYYLTKVARKLTDKEVHRTHNSYMNSFILKSYIMSFFNYYTVMFYNAFFKIANYTHPGDHDTYEKFFGMFADICPPSAGCVLELSIHAFVIMCKEYLMMMLMKTRFASMALKYVRKRLKGKREKKKWEKERLPQWEQDYELAKPSEFFFLQSFTSLILEYGLVIFFVAAMPLLPALAVLNNIVELRVTSTTLIRKIRRNVPKRIHGLGAWNTILDAVTRISFVISGCIIAFVSKFVNKTTYRIEHGSLHGYVNFTLSEFAIADFTPKIRNNILKKFPNMTTCYYTGFRKHYTATDKYEKSDTYYKYLSLALITVTVFAHLAVFLANYLEFRLAKLPTVIQEFFASEEQDKASQTVKSMKEGIIDEETTENAN